ncbi:hypothetical protein QFC19_006350 [Naganishia cerealis]|uniref:Uncharacterized protein n=1 Tax=Naganishia cerealis TaxID=610337 RepID=A0ACC2VGJ0_9TREE|nr:hypothetical protein QFC19_006350 [Naganishia cerealis]
MSYTNHPESTAGHQLTHIDSDDLKGEKYGGVNVHTGSDAMVMDAEKYGNYATDKDEFETEHTTTHRNLKPRHVSMIAIGGAVGSGLIIGSGSALSKAGPVGLLIGYSLVGLICFTVMTALGEMATWLPDKRGFPGYAVRMVDPALGFATGWNYLAKYLLISPNQIIASVVVIQYWDPEKHINAAVWCSIIIVVIVAINILGVAFFGEIEFWMSTCKVLVLVGLLLLGIILDLGGGPSKDRIGFRYWKSTLNGARINLLDAISNKLIHTIDPGPFAHYIYKNDVGVFLGVWYAIPNALFAYIGTELIGVTGKSFKPRNAQAEALIIAANASASPFVVAIRLAGIKFLPAFINGCILLFVFSAANSDVYIGSRTLFQLAVQGQAPAIFKRVDKRGIPHYALFFCISLYGALIWIVLLISHIRFRSAIKVQNFDTATLAYQAPFGKLGSIIALVSTIIIVIFKGYDAFMPKFAYKTFITNYIGILSFLGCYIGYKFYHKTTLVPLTEIDLQASHRFYAAQDDPEDVEEAPAVGFKAKAKRIFNRIIG